MDAFFEEITASMMTAATMAQTQNLGRFLAEILKQNMSSQTEKKFGTLRAMCGSSLIGLLEERWPRDL